MQEIQIWSLGWEDPLEKGMATHCRILAWRIPQTGEPAGYSPWGHRVRHDRAIEHTRPHSERPLAEQYSTPHVSKSVNLMKPLLCSCFWSLQHNLLCLQNWQIFHFWKLILFRKQRTSLGAKSSEWSEGSGYVILFGSQMRCDYKVMRLISLNDS